MSREPSFESNGAEPKATKAEHESLRDLVLRLSEKLDHLVDLSEHHATALDWVIKTLEADEDKGDDE